VLCRLERGQSTTLRPGASGRLRGQPPGEGAKDRVCLARALSRERRGGLADLSPRLLIPGPALAPKSNDMGRGPHASHNTPVAVHKLARAGPPPDLPWGPLPGRTAYDPGVRPLARKREDTIFVGRCRLFRGRPWYTAGPRRLYIGVSEVEKPPKQIAPPVRSWASDTRGFTFVVFQNQGPPPQVLDWCIWRVIEAGGRSLSLGADLCTGEGHLSQGSCLVDDSRQAKGCAHRLK